MAPAAMNGQVTPQLALPGDGNLSALGLIGADGLTVDQVNEELRRGAKFVVYPYVISFIVVTLKRGSNVYFVPAGKSSIAKGLPFLGISLALGWWGFPWGFVFTPYAIARVLTGGKNVTKALVEALNNNANEAAALVAKAAAAEGPRSGVLQTVPEPVAVQPAQTHKIPAVAAAPASHPAGWHRDPHGRARLRYWDGQAWTEHTHD